jgi:hypothetical protein
MLGVIVNGNNVRMFELGNQPGFTLEACFKIGIFTKGWVKNFQRHIAVQCGVIGLIYRSHTTLAELFHDPIWTDVLTDVERHLLAPENKLA